MVFSATFNRRLPLSGSPVFAASTSKEAPRNTRNKRREVEWANPTSVYSAYSAVLRFAFSVLCGLFWNASTDPAVLPCGAASVGWRFGERGLGRTRGRFLPILLPRKRSCRKIYRTVFLAEPQAK